jgi:hypothetical protein
MGITLLSSIGAAAFNPQPLKRLFISLLFLAYLYLYLYFAFIFLCRSLTPGRKKQGIVPHPIFQ